MTSDDWIAASEEPWTRYRHLVDVLGRSEHDDETAMCRSAMVAHPAIEGLLARADEWPGYPLKRHNDAAHPLYAIATLADFGLDRSDPGVDRIATRVIDRFDGEAFESLLWLPKFFTKEADDERWSWMLCDAPTLLFSLVSFGYGDHPDVDAAVGALLARAEDNGWRCAAAASIPRFSGPGRAADTCPMATTYVLKVMSLIPTHHGSEAVANGVDALLSHWEHQQDEKVRMFGIGTDFRKIKYPFVWYDVVHVADVLSRFEVARADARLAEMIEALTAQADQQGRYRAGSMYRAWKGWSFADKKVPSPWLTMLVRRIEARFDTGR